MATTTFKVVDFYRNNSSSLNSLNLGFNVTGGYSCDIPATIFNVNSDLLFNKLEEGDIILEINGVNARHLTLNEVLKQLRCCGNRVLLKLKSDPEYKMKFKELKDTKYKDLLLLATAPTTNSSNSTASSTPPLSISSSQSTTPTKYISPFRLQQTIQTTTTTPISTKDTGGIGGIIVNKITKTLSIQSDNNNLTFLRNASKSYDDFINDCVNNDDDNHVNGNLGDNVNSLIALPLNDTYESTKQELIESTPIKDMKQHKITPPLSLSPSTSSSSSSSSSSSASSTSTESPLQNIHMYDNNINFEYNSQIVSSSSSPPPIIHSITTTSIMPLINTTSISNNNTNNTAPAILNPFNIEIDEPTKRKIDEKLRDCNSDSDTEMNIYTPKAVDLPSAQRLAKRLFYLDGFKSNDIVKHLSKKNDFSQLVADEYLKLFNFQALTLDAALRKFLKQFQLVGEAQEKERVLMYFAKHYVDSNETAFNNVDTCHTLTCAIMLLNTDLHDNKVPNKMTLNEFIENLKGLNDGENFSDALLESLYNAIKNEPLECADIDVEDMPYEDRVGSLHGSNGINHHNQRTLSNNPFLQLPDPHLAKEYKFGWLLRKCCAETDGKKAPFLKRSWKMFYASLRDMVLYLHKDEKGLKANSFDNISNAIRIHHAYASVASDYKKKQFVFRLKTADWAEYLFQTSNITELNEWVNVINLVAAMFSSPPLASAVGSIKTFQRPLLPASVTRYTLQEQCDYHKKHIKQLQFDLSKLETTKDDRSFEKDKYNYFIFEIQRYTTYLKLLEDKINEESNTTLITNTNLVNGNYFNENNHDTSPIVITTTTTTTSPQILTTNTTTINNNNNNNHVLSTTPTLKKINNYVN